MSVRAPAAAGPFGLAGSPARSLRCSRESIPKPLSLVCAELLAPGRVRCRQPVTSRKAALELGARLLAADIPGTSWRQVLDALVARERLGSTDLGNGIALPHARMTRLEGQMGACVTLADAVDFDPPDERRVDVLFIVVLPPDQGHEQLRALVRALNATGVAERLRARTGPAGVHACLCGRDLTDPRVDGHRGRPAERTSGGGSSSFEPGFLHDTRFHSSRATSTHAA